MEDHEYQELIKELWALRNTVSRLGQLHHDLVEDDRLGRKFELSAITFRLGKALHEDGSPDRFTEIAGDLAAVLYLYPHYRCAAREPAGAIVRAIEFLHPKAGRAFRAGFSASEIYQQFFNDDEGSPEANKPFHLWDNPRQQVNLELPAIPKFTAEQIAQRTEQAKVRVAAFTGEQHDPHADPECATCGHVASDHRPGSCGASCEDDEGSVKCDCVGFKMERSNNGMLEWALSKMEELADRWKSYSDLCGRRLKRELDSEDYLRAAISQCEGGTYGDLAERLKQQAALMRQAAAIANRLLP